MAIVAKNNGGSNIEPIEPGMYVARCVSMFHIGTVEETYQNDLKHTNKVQLTWEIPALMHVFNEDKGAEPRVISKDFTLSMSPKANLRKTIEAWRGKPYTEEEAKEVDIAVLIGQPCMLNIVNKEAKSSGNKYADIMSITPPIKGAEVPAQINESLECNFDNIAQVWDKIPKFVQDKIKSSAEYKECGFVAPVEQAVSQSASAAPVLNKEEATTDATPEPAGNGINEGNGNGGADEPMF